MKRARSAASACAETAAPAGSMALQQLYYSRRVQSSPQSEKPEHAPAVATRPGSRKRCAVPGKVWVGSLDASTDASSLEAAFRPYGEVLDARVMYDGHGQERQSRGYGFVTFSEPESVALALRAMEGAVVDGSTVHVNEVFKSGSVGEPGEGGGPVRKRRSHAPHTQQSVSDVSAAPAGSPTSSSVSPIMMVPARHIGLVIGRGGSTVRQISSESGATVAIEPEPEANGTRQGLRKLELKGLPHQIQAARRLVSQLLARTTEQADKPDPRWQSGQSRRAAAQPDPDPETIVAGYINDAHIDIGEWR